MHQLKSGLPRHRKFADGIGFAEGDRRGVDRLLLKTMSYVPPEGARYQAAKLQFIYQRVEDNAFHI